MHKFGRQLKYALKLGLTECKAPHARTRLAFYLQHPCPSNCFIQSGSVCGTACVCLSAHGNPSLRLIMWFV
jgi:hypothetical protein